MGPGVNVVGIFVIYIKCCFYEKKKKKKKKKKKRMLWETCACTRFERKACTVAKID